MKYKIYIISKLLGKVITDVKRPFFVDFVSVVQMCTQSIGKDFDDEDDDADKEEEDDNDTNDDEDGDDGVIHTIEKRD